MFSRVRSQQGLAAVGATLLGYAVMVLAGVLGLVVPYAVAAVAAVAGELALAGRHTGTATLLDKAGLGETFRRLVRDLSVVLLVIAAVRPGVAGTVAVLLLPAALWTLAVATGAVTKVIDGRVDPPAYTRNIDLGALRRVPVPPAWARQLAGLRMPLLNVLLVPAAVVAAALDRVAPVVVTGLVTLAAGLVTAAVLALTALRGRGKAPGVLPAVHDWMARERPEVALYFAGPAKDVYQANMWLAPVEATGRRAVVLLRAADAFGQLADTRLPVICVPAGVDFMNLDLSSLRVALYAANVGANIHLLREPGVKHVFVGHGDSDKQASVNPYSKVYDEVWVAGPAGRERYARADVGVLDRDIVEIGRPQLAGVHTFGSGAADHRFTVLYAPTWEGWLDDDPYHTSLVLMGERIVSGLLAAGDVRVIYKPHPLTGTRSPKARAVHERIVSRIKAAGAETDPSSLDGAAHLVVTGRTPGLFDCFNVTDLLVSDVSSVVSDFVQSERPYVVANPAGLPEDEFRRQFPTARAAYLLSADCGELAKILDVSRAADDAMAGARRELKEYLLGPAGSNPMDRFRDEIGRLCG
ncbi:CDP-glycerol glycerophosphotransferase family protein [Micromonospora sp. WMMA1949]|uniref:CDP-glycerol glycerophosphotransferase family protein n=1 Tax=unclassified Micromonospora TaxID=2617518 RepID=UPI0022B70D67|nr:MULTISPECIES: CDP-glycerol glycerophosphotransferase family protein [unclassified Micromonospora]MCZ7424620.1 CDP-glycerol glycerophosphotransferase family protein [Micromonospora sp. WMMA1949]WBC09247.1 CDP-glycerol glycerophosphotransferase family protein [Micromonospora sp. WMMA1947]